MSDPSGSYSPDPRRPNAPTIRDTLSGVTADLAGAGVESPRVEAERLVAHVLAVERADLVLSGDRPFPAARARELATAVRRRVSGEPLQHIEGFAEFRGLRLIADGRALVPRPETEQLVDLVADWARGGGAVRVVSGVRAGRPPIGRALDIGTGSGAIALALATEHVAGTVLAIDRSRAALAQATENAGRCEAGDRVRFALVADGIWDAVGDQKFDVIVSNPPYVSDADIPGLPRDVRESRSRHGARRRPGWTRCGSRDPARCGRSPDNRRCPVPRAGA